MVKVRYALSLKQPWAALVALGLKTIEVRNWPTERRGLVLIHASRQTDARPRGWRALDGLDAARRLAELHGGIIGAAELQECRSYRSRTAFARDGPRHLNHPTWFQPPGLYGFVFANARVLPFRALPGWVRFFPVDWRSERE